MIDDCWWVIAIWSVVKEKRGKTVSIEEEHVFQNSKIKPHKVHPAPAIFVWVDSITYGAQMEFTLDPLGIDLHRVHVLDAFLQVRWIPGLSYLYNTDTWVRNNSSNNLSTAVVLEVYSTTLPG